MTMAGNNGENADFAEFEALGDVEVGDSNTAPKAKEAQKGAEKPAKEAPESNKDGSDIEDDVRFRPAREDAETPGEAEETGENDEDTETAKKRQPPSERIRELNKRLRQSERLRVADAERLDRLEAALKNNGGQGNNGSGNTGDIGVAPDPQDQTKYPLGHLDDRYIEDKLEWLAETKAAKKADAVLQRQQEHERNGQIENQQRELLTKVDDLASRGSEIYDDYQEMVVDAGMRGDWELTHTTFEAAAEAEHGERILYALANDPKEAKRVSELSPFQQLRYVDQQNAEISAKIKPRTKPGATPPAQTRTRGGNSSTRISPSTDNLDDFEKAWEAEGKGKR